jgi:hypothetical protein
VKKPTIAIGHIRGSSVEGPFHDSILRFLDFDSRNDRLCAAPGHVQGLYPDDNRNELAREFLTLKADYLLSVDTDIEFYPPQVYQLVKDAVEKDCAILSGLYFSYLYHTPNPNSTAYQPSGKLLPVWFEGTHPGGSIDVYRNFMKTEPIVKLDACGAGFCLIRRDVFEKMAEVPEWKADDWTWYGRDPFIWKGLPKRMGEDITFCVRAKRCGFQTWGHKGVILNHWKKVPLNADMFRAVAEYAKNHGQEY